MSSATEDERSELAMSPKDSAREVDGAEMELLNTAEDVVLESTKASMWQRECTALRPTVSIMKNT